MSYTFLLKNEIDLQELVLTHDGREHTYKIEDVIRARYESFVMRYSRMHPKTMIAELERTLYRAGREARKREERLLRERGRAKRKAEREAAKIGRARGYTWSDFEPPRGVVVRFGRPPVSIPHGGVVLDPRLSEMPARRRDEAGVVLRKAQRFASREQLPENYGVFVTYKDYESTVVKTTLHVWPKDGDVLTAPPRLVVQEALSDRALATHPKAGPEGLAQPVEHAEQIADPAESLTDDQGRVQAPHVDPFSAEFRAKKERRAEWVRKMVALTPDERREHADVAGAFDAHHEFLMTYTHNFTGGEAALAQRVKKNHGVDVGSGNYVYFRDIEAHNAQAEAEMNYFHALLDLEDDLERHQLLAQGRSPLVMPKDVQREKNIRLHGGLGNVVVA